MYLYKREEYYYFRIRVPKELVKYFTTTQIKQTLKTKNYQEAKSLSVLLYNSLQKLIWMIQYKMVSEKILDTIATNFKSFEKDLIVNELKNSPNAKSWIVEDLDMYDDIIASYKEVDYLNKTDIVQNDIEQLDKQYSNLNLDSEDKNRLSKKIASKHIQILQELKQEFENGVYNNSSTSQKIYNSDTVNSNQSTTTTTATIKDTYKLYLEHKANIEKVSNSSIKEYKATYKYLQLFFDIDDDISSISSKALKDMQKIMIKFPKNILSSNKYKDLTVNQILNLIGKSQSNIQTLSFSRINSIFIHIKSYFNFLVYEEYLLVNPVNVKPLNEVDKIKEAYNTTDIKNIFNSDIPLDIKNISLVALYSGMRIGEIVSLQKSDIICKNNILYFDLKKGKTINAPRVIPIHSKIVPIIKNLLNDKSNNTSLLFNYNYNAIQKRVNRYLQKIIPSKSKSFHSFRKSFITQLYKNYANYEMYIKVLVGHSTKSNLTYHTYANNNLEDNIKIKMVESIIYDI